MKITPKLLKEMIEQQLKEKTMLLEEPLPPETEKEPVAEAFKRTSKKPGKDVKSDRSSK